MAARSNHALYRPSGGIHSARLVPVFVGLVAASAAIGALLFTLLAQGWYFAALSIVIPVAVACGFSGWAVRFSHCRNPLWAGMLGACCGLLGYATYFQIDQCVRWHAPITAIERLPGYVAYRMETDRWLMHRQGAVLAPQPQQQGVEPAVSLFRVRLASWNWGMLLLESLALAIAPLATAVHAARRPYSERWQRWCERESLCLAKEAAATLRTALAAGTVEAWVESGPRLVTDRQPHHRLTLWYTPASEPEEGAVEAVLSLNRGPLLRLKAHEASAFLSLLPAMRTMSGFQPTGERPSLRDFDPTVARIWHVPKTSRGRRIRLGGELRKVIKGLKIAAPLAAILLAVAGGTWCLRQFVVTPGLVGPWLLPAFALGVGIPLMIWMGLRLPFRRLWQWHLDDAQKLLLEKIGARQDALVQANDPRAIYAEMLPRRLWEAGRSSRSDESNEGLMRFDEDRDAVLFEGENQRFLLPSHSIQSARIEALPGVCRPVEGLFCVVVHVRLAAGTWELPFFPLRGLPTTSNWERAAQLLAALEEFCGRQLADEPIAPSEPLELATR